LGVSAFRYGAPSAWKFGLKDEDTCTSAGTSSSTNASYRGNQYGSVIGGEVQCPPDGSGLTLAPTKPSSDTHRRSSAIDWSSGLPGVCGSWHTAAKCSGNSRLTRCT